MSSAVKDVVIVGAKRTAFGKYGGKLSNTKLDGLLAKTFQATFDTSGVKPDSVDTVNVGNVLTDSNSDGHYIARHAALKAGIPIQKPALTVNRLCGSGFQSIINSCQDLATGLAEISLAGAVENMSAATYSTFDVKAGLSLGQNITLIDSLWIDDSYCKMSMALTAEKLGELYKITRDEADDFSLQSQIKWKRAQEAGAFEEEITPIPIESEHGIINFELDEHPRPQSTKEGLAQLKSLFKKNGLVTAGSASGICDGAGALILATDAAASKHNLQPLARILSFASVGCDPTIMGIGPVPAINAALKVAGKKLNEMDLIEINEAFAAQTLACVKILDLDMNKLNVNGGAIAMGHPLAASGARIITHLVYELRRKNLKYAVGAACIGGGQGIAIAIESI